MTLDYPFIKSLSCELSDELTGGRIEKIRQIDKTLIIMTVRLNGVNRDILFSARPGTARVHITSADFESPSQPPMFCTLLRKHILNSVITDISIGNGDRIIEFSLSCSDYLGRKSEKKLAAELFSRSPDLVLIDDENRIIDSLNRKKHNPGLFYRYPDKPIETADGNDNEKTEMDRSLSSFLDEYYSELEKSELSKRNGKELRNTVNSARKRISRKLTAQRIELQKAQGREDVRRRADLITANIYLISKGARVLKCYDFYEEGSPEVEIELDPFKSPQDNAASLYKQYRKLKTAEEYLTELILKAEEQLDYLDSILDELTRASTADEFEAIKAEIAQTGIAGKKQDRRKKGNSKPKKLPMLSFSTVNGFIVYVGRNNVQNEELTFRIAHNSDYWFHVKNYHGSHVVMTVRNSVPADSDMAEAAELACRYSEAGGTAGTEVDYCLVRNVKRQNAGLPGRVYYTDFKTVRT